MLSTLRLDALCRELVNGKDFDLSAEEEKATEWELQRVAYHISERCALDAVDQYKEVFDVFPLASFWIHRNGYTERQRHFGIAIGFYLGIASSALVVWLYYRDSPGGSQWVPTNVAQMWICHESGSTPARFVSPSQILLCPRNSAAILFRAWEP